MIFVEVIVMDENKQEIQQPGYVERPKWQVWLARVAVVLMSAFVVFQVLNLLFGWGA
jgi:hypothetical protein